MFRFWYLKLQSLKHIFLFVQAQRLSLIDQLPDEPGPECTEPVTKLRFRLPNGEQATRRFLAVSPLRVSTHQLLCS